MTRALVEQSHLVISSKDNESAGISHGLDDAGKPGEAFAAGMLVITSPVGLSWGHQLIDKLSKN